MSDMSDQVPHQTLSATDVLQQPQFSYLRLAGLGLGVRPNCALPAGGRGAKCLTGLGAGLTAGGGTGLRCGLIRGGGTGGRGLGGGTGRRNLTGR